MDAESLHQAMEGNNIMFVPTGETSRDVGASMIEGVSDEGTHIVYISVSKPALTRKQELKERGIDDENIFFIDGSKTDDKKRILVPACCSHA